MDQKIRCCRSELTRRLHGLEGRVGMEAIKTSSFHCHSVLAARVRMEALKTSEFHCHSAFTLIQTRGSEKLQDNKQGPIGHCAHIRINVQCGTWWWEATPSGALRWFYRNWTWLYMSLNKQKMVKELINWMVSLNGFIYHFISFLFLNVLYSY